MGPIGVLIVEDDENYREIVSSELEWHGFAVCSFADGDELLGSPMLSARPMSSFWTGGCLPFRASTCYPNWANAA